MSTSLQEQLRKLRTPQTNLLHDSKKRPSFMFDAGEAATISRATFYEIGLNGLKELIALDNNFSKFSNTLFQESSLYLQRTVETKEVNDQLDEQIRDLFYHLIPYFSIRPAHCVLEWLIVRYNCQSFNTDDMLFFLLPYYHTKLFARALQVVDIKSHASRWNWLFKVQQKCIVLSKNVLYTRCATDAFLLKLICKKTVEAVQLVGSSTNMSTLINFYTSCLVGVIEYASPLTELHISHMLPSLFEALESEERTFTLGAFVVFNFMMSKIKLKKNIVQNIMKKVIKVKKNVHEEQTLLLVSIYQKYPSTILPTVSLKSLAKKDWFIKNLILTFNDPDEFDVFPICYQIISQCISYIRENQKPNMENDEIETLKKIKILGMHIILNIKFQDEEVIQSLEMIKDVFQSKQTTINTNENGDSTKSINDNIPDKPGLVKYCSKLIETFEKQYPNAWDQFMYKYTTNQNEAHKLSKDQRAILTLSVGENTSQADIYFKLNNSNGIVRAETIKYLTTTNDIDLRESIKHTIVNLWNDDEPCVIQALAVLPYKHWCLDFNGIIQILVEIYQNYTENTNKWKQTVEILLEKIFNHEILLNLNENSEERVKTLLTMLPYLIVDKQFEIILMKTKFVQNDSTCNFIKKGISKENALNLLIKNKNLPHFESIMNVINKYNEFNKPIYVVFSCLLITTQLNDNANPDDLLKIFKFISKIYNVKNISHKIIYNEDEGFNEKKINQCVQIINNKSKLPLYVYVYFMNKFISKINIDKYKQTNNLWKYCCEENENNKHSILLIKMFVYFVNKCNEYEKNEQNILLKIYISLIKNFINYFISNIHEQIEFYVNLSINYKCDINIKIWCLNIINQLIIKNQIQINESYLNYFIILLYSKNEHIRNLVLDILYTFMNSFTGILNKNNLISFIKEILEYREEIYIDNMCLIQYVGIILNKITYKNTLYNILNIINDVQTPYYIIKKYLNIIQNVNSFDMFKKLIEIVQRIYKDENILENNNERIVLNEDKSEIIINILNRFVLHINEVLNDETCWNNIQTYISNFNIKLQINNKETKTSEENAKTTETILVANIIFNNITIEHYEQLNDNGKRKILNLIFIIKNQTENDEILICIKDFIKKINFNCKLIENIFKQMITFGINNGNNNNNEKSLRRRKVTIDLPNVEIIQSNEWKLGIVLMESIEHKKKLENTQIIIPYLFQILKKCLQFDEQIYVEYIKQLCISCIYNCIIKIQDGDNNENLKQYGGNLNLGYIDIDSIVESIRSSKNPTTHYQALNLLSYLAQIYPKDILKKFMPIFTFMGNSILRLDDAYSLQIINKVIENVIPVILNSNEMVATNKSKQQLNKLNQEEDNVIEVLRVFTDAIMDIPDHRRIYLMEKLLNILNNGHYLYVFLQLIFERHVIHPEIINEINTVKRYDKDIQTSSPNGMPKRLKIALHICSKFQLNILIETCYKLLKFVQYIPNDKDESFVNEETRRKVMKIIKIDKITPKQFRHYKYTLLMFISSLLSSHHVVALINKYNENKGHEEHKLIEVQVNEIFKNCIEEILQYIQIVSKQVDANNVYNKYWKGMLTQCYDILDKINALIDSDIFVNVIKKLLKHTNLSLRKRCLDMLNWRLQQKHNIHMDNLNVLLKPLVHIVINKDNGNTIETAMNQQTALISIKLFVKNIGEDNIEIFKDILDNLMILFNQKHELTVIASLILCIAEICSILKVNTLSILPIFMPKLINMLNSTKTYSDIITLSIISSLLKIIENLSLFISPYLQDILYQICILNAMIENETEHAQKSLEQTHAQKNSNELTHMQHKTDKSLNIKNKINYLKNKVALDIPHRVVLTSVGKCFNQLIESKNYKAIGALMNILGESFSSNDFIYNNEITEFFLTALNFRVSNGDVGEDNIAVVENGVIHAFVQLILKLSESNFKPLFNKIYDWAFRNNNQLYKDRIITFFLLTSGISSALKSLFVLFAGIIFKDCVSILDQTNLSKHSESELYFKSNINKNVVLLDAVLTTLLNIFTHDVHQFMCPEKFHLIMQHLVDQLESKLLNYKNRCISLLQPCIVTFALSCNDDVLWKTINYEIAIKTRDNDSYVRLVSLQTILLLAKKLGDSFLPLLPETVPFLSELLEDENEQVEKTCRQVVQEMEIILQEPISKYF